MRYLFFLFFPLFLLYAQEDSVPLKDSLVFISEKAVEKKILPLSNFNPSPVKAGLYSALLPGLGQFYNKKYWKIPLSIGLIGGGLYFVNYYQKRYQRYRNAFLAEIDGLSHEFSGFTTKEQLASVQQDEGRSFNYALVITLGLYILNIIDAIVDAHLYEPPADPTLSLKPIYMQNDNNQAIGLGLKYRF